MYITMLKLLIDNDFKEHVLRFCHVTDIYIRKYQIYYCKKLIADINNIN